MTMQADRKIDEKYNNWVKASLLLYYVKQGLEPIADDGSHVLHDYLRQHAQQQLSVQTTCTQCKSMDIKKTDIKRGMWKTACPICRVYVNELLKLHANGTRIVWRNTEPTLWSSHPWEVAKVFLPRGCTKQTSAQEADVAALLTFFTDCGLMNKFVSNLQILHEVKAIRNSVMHSPNLEVSNSDLKAWSEKLIALLEDKHHFVMQESCQRAVENIKQLLDTKQGEILTTEQELTALQHRRESSRKDVDNVESLIEQVKTEMKEEINTIKAEFTSVQKDLQKLGCNVEANTNHLQQVDTQLKENYEMVKKLNTDVENAAKLSTDARDNSDRIETLFETVKAACAEIETERTRIEQRQLFISDENRQLESFTSTIDTQIRTLKDLAKMLHSSKNGQVHFGAGSIREDKEEDNNIKDLRHRLISIYEEHCGRISISPMVPEKSEPMADIYVLPSLQIIEPPIPGTSSEQCETSKMNYKDIFFNETEDCKNIYITGDAGVGKSTFCKKMVNTWCRAHSDVQDMSDDEKTMLSFPLLFYISLRSTASQSSIAEMIQSQLVNDDVERLLSNVKCLVLLDGLDEWKQTHLIQSQFQNKDLPKRPVYNKCTFLTTCRSWKFTTLKLQRNEYDKHVQIMGLDASSAEKLARCVIETQNIKQKRDFTYEKFRSALKKQRIVHFMSIPLILLQLLCLWFDGKPFGKSHCEIYANIIELQLKYAEETQNLEIIAQFETKTKLKLPDCFKTKRLCQKYKASLYTVSKMAFDILFGNMSGVSDLDQSMHKAHIEACQMSGILTRTSLDTSISERHSILHFAHRTYQQFFAAVFMVTQSWDLSSIFKKMCTLDNFVEIPDLFVFVLGMNQRVGSSMLQYIMKAIACDDRLHKSRRSFTDKVTSSLVVQLQNVLMNIFEESDNSGNSYLHFSVEDIKVDRRNIMHVEKHLDKLKIKRLKSVHMKTSNISDSQRRMYKKIFKKVLRSNVLEKISLKDNNNFIASDNIFILIKGARNTLRSLQLEYVNVSKLSKRISVIYDTECLESICLRCIYLTHEQIEILSQFPCKRTEKSVKEVHLEGFRCLDHGPLGECQYSIDLSKHRLKTIRILDMDIRTIQVFAEHLEILQISNLLIPGTIGSLFTQLIQAPLLHTIQVKYCKEEKDVGIVMQTLPTIVCLKNLELSDVDIEGHSILLFPNLKMVQFVGLKDISILCKDLIRFIDSLSLSNGAHPAPIDDLIVEIRMKRLTILEEEFEGQFRQYLQNLNNLKRIQLEDGVCIQAARYET